MESLCPTSLDKIDNSGHQLEVVESSVSAFEGVNVRAQHFRERRRKEMKKKIFQDPQWEERKAWTQHCWNWRKVQSPQVQRAEEEDGKENITKKERKKELDLVKKVRRQD